MGKGDGFREFRDEMKRVSWPSSGELMGLGKIVLGVVFVCGLGIYCFDLCIKFSIDFFTHCIRVLGG